MISVSSGRSGSTNHPAPIQIDVFFMGMDGTALESIGRLAIPLNQYIASVQNATTGQTEATIQPKDTIQPPKSHLWKKMPKGASFQMGANLKLYSYQGFLDFLENRLQSVRLNGFPGAMPSAVRHRFDTPSRFPAASAHRR